MRLHTKITQFTLAAFLFGATFACFAQAPEHKSA